MGDCIPDYDDDFFVEDGKHFVVLKTDDLLLFVGLLLYFVLFLHSLSESD